LKRTFFILIISFFALTILFLSSAAEILAMSKRPKAGKEEKTEEFVLPEIEIISKPEANRELLSEDRKKSESRVQVSPPEVLPAVGEDATELKKSYKTIDIQRALANAGFSPGAIDGKMGAKTKKAIQEFQKEHNLTVDGIVGPKTWERLVPYINKPKNKKEN
jgi:murein L,D-transpeptidase YcbB/YkuD